MEEWINHWVEAELMEILPILAIRNGGRQEPISNASQKVKFSINWDPNNPFQYTTEEIFSFMQKYGRISSMRIWTSHTTALIEIWGIDVPVSDLYLEKGDPLNPMTVRLWDKERQHARHRYQRLSCVDNYF